MLCSLIPESDLPLIEEERYVDEIGNVKLKAIAIQPTTNDAANVAAGTTDVSYKALAVSVWEDASHAELHPVLLTYTQLDLEDSDFQPPPTFPP